MRSLRLLDNERAGEVSPAVCGTKSMLEKTQEVAVRSIDTHKIIALARERWVYPAMLEEIVVSETVKPTD